MSIGGNSTNDGISFISDNYTAKFIMDKNNHYKISTSKRIQMNGIRNRMKDIPLIKGLYTLFEGKPVMAAGVLITVSSDILLQLNRHNEQSDAIFAALIIVAVAAFILIAYIFKKTIYKIKNVWMFHGAEHKTIYACENNIELTLENVRKCPRIAKRCGTNLVVFLVLFYIVIAFLTNYASIKLVVSFVLAYELFDIENGDEIPFLKMFFKFGYWCQQNLFTREPSDIQLIASIETVKELQKLESESES